MYKHSCCLRSNTVFISFKPTGKPQLKITVYLTMYGMLLVLYTVECLESDIASVNLKELKNQVESQAFV
jgi:hypothetical protein